LEVIQNLYSLYWSLTDNLVFRLLEVTGNVWLTVTPHTVLLFIVYTVTVTVTVNDIVHRVYDY